MFCTKCGTQNTDDSRFCGNCGTPLVSAPVQQSAYQPVPEQLAYQPVPEQPVYQPAPEQPVYQPVPEQPTYQAEPQPVYQPAPQQPYAPYGQPMQQPYTPYALKTEKPKNNKTLWLILAAVGVVALAAVLLIVLLGGGGGNPEDVAEGFVESIMDGNINGAMDYIHDSMHEDMDLGDVDEFEMMAQYIDVNSIEAVESEKYSKSDLADLCEDLEYDFDNLPEISEAYDVSVEVDVEFMGQSASETMRVVVGEIDGDWYVVYVH